MEVFLHYAVVRKLLSVSPLHLLLDVCDIHLELIPPFEAVLDVLKIFLKDLGSNPHLLSAYF